MKTRLPELVTGVERREEEIIVTRKGKPVDVVVNYSEYERLKETLDVLADPELMRQIARSKRTPGLRPVRMFALSRTSMASSNIPLPR